MDATATKKNIERSRSYPFFSLKECVDLTHKIHSELGNRFSTRKEIADIMNISEGYIVKFVSACVQFDLLENQYGTGYKPSETFLRKILLAENENEKRNILIECLKKPALYSELFEKYNNSKLPSALPVILCKDFGIQLTAKDKAASIFTDSLNFVNVLSSDGTISIPNISTQEQEEAEEESGESRHNADTPIADTSTNSTKPKNFNQAGKKRADIKINNGRFITIEFPEDINNQEIEKIISNLLTWKD